MCEPQRGHTLYQFSRSIYRRLAPDLSGADSTEVARKRAELLRATELAMDRIGSDPLYFAHPTRSIFREIRLLFPMTRHRRVYEVVDRHVALALRFVEQHARAGVTFDGSPRRCSSNTRKGRPCERPPIPASQYCASHRHLEEDAERAPVAA